MKGNEYASGAGTSPGRDLNTEGAPKSSATYGGEWKEDLAKGTNRTKNQQQAIDTPGYKGPGEDLGK